MNFDLSDEQRLLQDTIRGFLDKECPPTHLRAVFEGSGHDPTLWKGMVELGLGGLHLSDEWGGAGQLGGQGVTRDTLKPGDVVVITGNPGRDAADHRMRMVSLKRTSDGFGWGSKPGEVVQ